ncbi:hypothetical protein Cs7R123_58630 [Catellatospora sp. TT07R-123]|uniref:hypothetical protein n=1 Tax=Catellatospora sp. TT07R-123 TaxID=2733863 RepID=UPI001B06B2BB|nr:hypothetical protein [Catellatospora sp. TT07R-123]GHJ48521.1 hypothetical protein Cs7R123_58630 [Catellatospora sp. TT07R-123]
MGFIQIIEYETDRFNEVAALMQAREQEMDGPPPFKLLRVARDRDNPRRYLTIVEFDSYEAAMANSADPRTGEMAGAMAALVATGPVFHNLDVLHAI